MHLGRLHGFAPPRNDHNKLCDLQYPNTPMHKGGVHNTSNVFGHNLAFCESISPLSHMGEWTPTTTLKKVQPQHFKPLIFRFQIRKSHKYMGVGRVRDAVLYIVHFHKSCLYIPFRDMYMYFPFAYQLGDIASC